MCNYGNYKRSLVLVQIW